MTPASYYKDSDNHNMLSLFIAYFVEEFVTDDQLILAKDTAVSFTNFLIDTYDFETFATAGSNDEYREQWLQFIGVTIDYEPDYDLSSYDGSSYSKSEEYPLIMIDQKHDFLFMKQEGHIDTPEDIMKMLEYLEIRVLYLLDKIKEETPQYYEEVSQRWNDEIYYDFHNTNRLGGIARADGTIDIKEINRGIAHETFHVILPSHSKNRQEGRYWITEGMTYYLSDKEGIDIFRDEVEMEHYWKALGFDKDESTLSIIEDEPEVTTILRNYYLSKVPRPNTIDELQYELFSTCLGMLELAYPDFVLEQLEDSSGLTTIYEQKTNKKPPVGSDDILTYTSGSVFIDYLVETYGFDKIMIIYFEGGEFIDVIGKTQKEARTDCIKQIKLELDSIITESEIEM